MEHENASVYSDIYKDAHGFRPHLHRFVQLTEAEQLAAIDRVAALVAEQLEAERAEDEIQQRRVFGAKGPSNPFADFFGA